MPAGVPDGTATLPVNGSSAGTGAPPIEVAGVVTEPVIVDGVTGTPFKVSLA